MRSGRERGTKGRWPGDQTHGTKSNLYLKVPFLFVRLANQGNNWLKAIALLLFLLWQPWRHDHLYLDALRMLICGPLNIFFIWGYFVFTIFHNNLHILIL